MLMQRNIYCSTTALRMASFWRFLIFICLCTESFCCNSGWYPFQGKCYKASTNLYSVEMARRYCEVSGGQLAYVNSTDILRFISGIPGFNSANDYWISDDSALPEPTTTSSVVIIHNQDEPSTDPDVLTTFAQPTDSCRYVKILKIKIEFCEVEKYFVCESKYPDETDVCPVGFDHYGSHCYRAITVAPSNYDDAVKYCALQKSKLATLENEDKEWEAKSVLLGKEDIFLVAAKKYDGVLKWSNEVLFNPIHEVFANDTGGECVGFLSEPGHPLIFRWAHVDCDKRSNFLCEVDRLPPKTSESTTVGTTTTMLPPLTCPHGYNWKQHEESGYCFWETTYESERLNWFEAREFCKHYGGDLASYDNEEQERIGLGGAAGHFKGLWIGMKRDEHDVFHWVDGSTLNFSNWEINEPNLKSPSKFCVSHASVSSKWELDYCGVRRWFICKAPKTRESIAPYHRQERKTKCDIKGVSTYRTQWYKFEDHCYLIQDKAEYTWDTARTFCQDNGGHLASVHSFQETNFILSIISGYPVKNYWIGLSLSGIHSTYEWTDNTPLGFIYWSDKKQEEKNFTSCVDFDKREGSWNVNHCNRFQGAICKRGINATYDFSTTEPSVIMPGNCEKEWYNLGNKCYKFFGSLWSQRVTWELANKECQDVGASLVSVHSKEEQEFLADVLLEGGSDAWIGLRGFEMGTIFHWSDDTRLDFTYWKGNAPEYSSEKDSPFNTGANSCVIMVNSVLIGLWNDVRCSNKNGYICQKMKDPNNAESYQDPFACPTIPGWFKLGTSCYKTFEQYNMTWLEAQRECQKNQANLVTVNSDALTYFIKRKFKLENATNSYSWIGVREVKLNNYEYVTLKPLFYSNWMGGQPKAASSFLDNCVAVQRDGRWLVRSCKEKHPFICSVTIEEDTTPEPAVDKTHMCSNLTGYWHDFGGTNCYTYEMDLKLSWVDAMHYCFKHGGYLASFHSAEEIKKLVNDMTMSYVFFLPVHIGLGKKRDGSFAWVDSSPLDFTQWDEDVEGERSHECVDMDIRTQKWRTVDCEEILRGFICSAPKPPKTSSEEHLISNKEDEDIIPKKLKIGGIFGIVICILVIAAVIGVTVYYLKFPKPVQPTLLESDVYSEQL